MIRLLHNNITINRETKTISHRSKTFKFDGAEYKTKNLRFELACYLILSDGASAEMAFWHLYADDSEGGPLYGPDIIKVMLNKLAKDLAEIDLSARSWKISGVTYYEIVPRSQAMISKRFSHGNARSIVQLGGTRISSLKEKNEPAGRAVLP